MIGAPSQATASTTATVAWFTGAAPVSGWNLLTRLTADPATAIIPLLVCSISPPYLAAVQQPTLS